MALVKLLSSISPQSAFFVARSLPADAYSTEAQEREVVLAPVVLWSVLIALLVHLSQRNHRLQSLAFDMFPFAAF